MSVFVPGHRLPWDWDCFIVLERKPTQEAKKWKKKN